MDPVSLLLLMLLFVVDSMDEEEEVGMGLIGVKGENEYDKSTIVGTVGAVDNDEIVVASVILA